jgi:hypothetical protein
MAGRHGFRVARVAMAEIQRISPGPRRPARVVPARVRDSATRTRTVATTAS